jgi:hypothetical protein
VLSPTPVTFTLPTLPSHLGVLSPLPTDTVGVGGAVVVDASSIVSWDAALARGVLDLFDAGLFGSDQFEFVRSQFTSMH